MPKEKRVPEKRQKPSRKDIRAGEGLKWTTHLINGKYYNRIPYGREKDRDVVEEVCYYCETREKSYHLHGCPNEVCPGCSDQAINCPCEAIECKVCGSISCVCR